MTIASFFSGCGGLDLGFKQAGFKIIWANEFDNSIHDTYRYNHPDTPLCTTDLRMIKPEDIPTCDGFIGGPPCQSWSRGGRQRGLEDERGKLFITYINLISKKKPKFFVIENVEGIISEKHFKTFMSFIEILSNCGYQVYYDLIDCSRFKIPQDRKRVFIIGIRNDLNLQYSFPLPTCTEPITLRQAISDIKIPPRFYLNNEVKLNSNGNIYNHDTYIGEYDEKFMSRNRVRSWDETSFTIQALAKNCPIHPQAPKMIFVNNNKRIFAPGHEHLYRRLSVRECARIQTFPDKFIFIYNKIQNGYKMVGNAVPPRIGYNIANSISRCFKSHNKNLPVLIGYYKNQEHLDTINQTKLYYVRIGLTKGAIKIPAGIDPPKYLILHNKNNIHYFILESGIPYEIDNITLKHIGFKPKHKTYFAFSINCKINDLPITNSQMNILMNSMCSYSPQILCL